jgi:invasion protein IalB
MIKIQVQAKLAASFLLGMAFLLAPVAAISASPKSLLKQPRHWAAFIIKESDGTACYMVGRPISTKPKNVKRGKVWILVTHRPYNKTRNVISVFAGYPYKIGSEAKVAIDDKTYSLDTNEETAWTKNASIDATMVEAMRAGRRLKVEGMSKRGTKTTDTFSLKGFSRAHDAIGKACDIR